ncbi:hypothetical protein JTB14_016370 [Gonioctena quinquepunctata]|nr:hypothetical protein JTB14_016370 [Gonioctena quinquepunctata]
MELCNIKFVGEVEKHPEPYDYNLREYSRKDCTEKTWNEIAKEFNMSASECKEKWRNLRSTYVKNLKPKPSGSEATKKPCYLMDAMQFAVPFVKVAGTISGNLPQIPEQRPPSSTTPVVEMEVSQEESVFSEDILSASHASLPPSPQFTPLPQPTPSPLPASPVENEAPPVSMGSGQQGPRGRKRKTQTEQSDAEIAFAKYFAAKTQKISNSSSTDVEREGIQKPHP